MSADYTVAIGYKIDSSGLTNAQTQVDKVNSSLKSSTASAEKLGEEIGSKLKDALGGAADEAGVFGEVLSSIGPIGLGVAAVVGSIAAAFKTVTETLEKANDINDFAAATHISADALDELQAVALKSGVSFDVAKGSVVKLNEQIASAENGNKKAIVAFNNLGLSVEKLSKLTPLEQIFEVKKAQDSLTDVSQIIKTNSQLLGDTEGKINKITDAYSDASQAASDSKFLQYGEHLRELSDEQEKAQIKVNVAFQEAKLALTAAYGDDAVALIKSFAQGIKDAVELAKQLNAQWNGGPEVKDSFLSSTITDVQNLIKLYKDGAAFAKQFYANVKNAYRTDGMFESDGDAPPVTFSGIQSGSSTTAPPQPFKSKAGGTNALPTKDNSLKESAKEAEEYQKVIDSLFAKFDQYNSDAESLAASTASITDVASIKAAQEQYKITHDVQSAINEVKAKNKDLDSESLGILIAYAANSAYAKDTEEQRNKAKIDQVKYEQQLKDYEQQIADTNKEASLIADGTLSTTQQITHYEQVRLETEKLINDAKSKGQDYDEDALKSKAEESVASKEALAKQKQSISDIDNYIKGVNEQIASGLADAIADGLASGKLDFKGFLADLGKYLVQSGLKALFNSLFSGPSSGGGGIFGTLINGIVGYFTGGSSTSQGIQGGVEGYSGSYAANGAAFYHGDKFFASGGLVNGRTKFGMNGGTGIMGEAGPEAIMPLVRGSNGKLGVASSGSQGNTVVINNTVNVSGADDPQKTADASTKALNKLIEQKVISVIADQRRSGNQLNPPIQTYQ